MYELKPIPVKELKFTPNTLSVHKNYSSHSVRTARDEEKGKAGDIFYIEGWGVFELEGIFEYNNVSEYCMDKRCVFEEGYGYLYGTDAGANMLFAILDDLYGIVKPIYSHILRKLPDTLQVIEK